MGSAVGHRCGDKQHQLTRAAAEPTPSRPLPRSEATPVQTCRKRAARAPTACSIQLRWQDRAQLAQTDCLGVHRVRKPLLTVPPCRLAPTAATFRHSDNLRGHHPATPRRRGLRQMGSAWSSGALFMNRLSTMRWKIIGNKFIKIVGKSKACMVYKLSIIFRRTRWTMYSYYIA
jgi:hypothetical protein